MTDDIAALLAEVRALAVREAAADVAIAEREARIDEALRQVQP